MGIREAATYPSRRPEETIRCISGVRVVPPILVWQLRASKCGYLLCEHHFSPKKIRCAHVLKKKAKSPRCRTADAKNLLSNDMVDCCCVYFLRIGRSAFHFVPRIRVIWQRFDVDFRQLCDVLDTEKTKNRAAVHTHDPLHIYATIGGIAADEIWAEGIAAKEGGRKMMCLFLRLRDRVLHNGR